MGEGYLQFVRGEAVEAFSHYAEGEGRGGSEGEVESGVEGGEGKERGRRRRWG